jgi:cytochrome P450
VGSVRPTNRYEGFVDNIVDFKGAHIATIDHHLHRQRRKPLDAYFSRQGISKFEPMLAELTEKLNKRFDDVKGTGKVIRLDHALTSYSGDVIQRLCMDNPPNTLIEDEEFSPWWYYMFHRGIGLLPLFMALPGLITYYRPP